LVETNKAKASISGSDFGITEIQSEVSYTVALSNVINANAFKAEVNFDASSLEFVRAESLLSNTIFATTASENSAASITIGTSDYKTLSTSTNIAKFIFKVKTNALLGDTDVTLLSADSASKLVDNSVTDNETEIEVSKTPTEILSYEVLSDITMDGKVTLADLSIALSYYQTTNKSADINLDGLVDTMDYIIMAGFIK
jgi:hypothetical protein